MSNKLTKEERKEFRDLVFSWLDDNDSSDLEEIVKWVSKKKEEWQEEAYEKGKEDADFLNNQFNRP